MRQCVRVHGVVIESPNLFGKSRKTEYDCFVAFENYREHLQLLKDFLKYYCSYDVDANPQDSHRVLEDRNCARALVTYYFREKSQRFKDEQTEFISKSRLPNREADQKSDKHELWVEILNSVEIHTPKSAAWLLYEHCESNKLPVGEAKALIRKEFNEQHFLWPDVLYEFEKLGGAYTDKYLRRRR
jgi:hypothetical protein